MQLISPGVDVEIIDESIYTGSNPGTLPLIVIATAANKALPSGSTGIATYTTAAKANQLYLATSQRDLTQAFGAFKFQNVQGTPLHGSELNEYGLQAAYSYLGIANQAYILRADIDLAALAASNSEPAGPPEPGTYWLNTSATKWGLFRANGNSLPGASWVNQTVAVVTAANAVLQNGRYVPSPTFGADGMYAVVVVSADNRIYQRVDGQWYEIGTSAWIAKFPTVITGKNAVPPLIPIGNSFTINGSVVTITSGGSLVDAVAAINAAAIPNIVSEITNDCLSVFHTLGGQIAISNTVGTPLANLGITPGVYNGVQVFRTNNAQWPDGSTEGSVWIKGSAPAKGASWSVNYYSSASSTWNAVTAPFYPYDSSLSDGDAAKDVAALAGLGIPTAGAVYVGYDAAQGNQTLRYWDGSKWIDLTYEASPTAPVTAPLAGSYWFSSDFKVDVMVGNGMAWNGYRRRYQNTDPEGVILDGSQPTTQTDGTPLVDNDLWINTTDLENYPALHRYSAQTKSWAAVDLTDQDTPFGIVFSDARQDSGVAFTNIPNAGHYAYNSTAMADLLVSDYVDPDAPDARTFPDGMILFNTRVSTYNVKKWVPNHFNKGGFDPNTDFTQESYNIGDVFFPPITNAGRWVTASGNQYNGAPYMGHKAQRAMVVRAMAAAIESNQTIRSELIYYNLISAPGYPELIADMVTLNTDQKNFSFIVGDTPARLPANSNAIQQWATNAAVVPDNGDAGLVTTSPYVGIYYPWGYSKDLSGNAIMIPPSAIALNTIAYSDQVSYPWFPPAGFQRGLVNNASSVGYLTSDGHNEFVPVVLNQGQRDTLYINKINPIAFIPTRGLVVYGQKTLDPVAQAMDRVNVVRLVCFLAYKLDTMLKVFLFELNDTHTRTAAKALVERFLTNLVSLRALYDFLVVCDETNNTAERIDANELWIDILIKPEKAIEFIYVPVRLESTGANLKTVASSLTATPGIGAN